MVSQYIHRRVDPEEFNGLLREAGTNINDFLFITGRKGLNVVKFKGGDTRGWQPMMGDILLLELLKQGYVTFDELADIVNAYIVDRGPGVEELEDI